MLLQLLLQLLHNASFDKVKRALPITVPPYNNNYSCYFSASEVMPLWRYTNLFIIIIIIITSTTHTANHDPTLR